MRRSILVLGLSLVLVIAGFASSAEAAITGLQSVQAQSPSDSSDKSVTVNCAPGKQVLGGGAERFGVGDGDNVAINDVIPNGALTSVAARALEDQNGESGSWSVRAHARCATPPPGLERIVATSQNDSLNKTVTATCPAGKRLLGAGGEIDGGGRQVVLEDVRADNMTSVTVQGVEAEAGTIVDWRARAYAICANPVGGLERIAATSPSDSINPKGAIATCPAGKQLVGAGAELGGGGGEVTLGRVVPSNSTVQANGFEDETGAGGSWFVRAIAICAATSERVVATSPNDSLTKSVTATCPAGTQVTGVGGDITAGGGQVFLEELLPFQTDARAAGAEDDNGFSGNWFVRSYAICATPLPGQEEVFAVSAQDSSNKSVTATCPAGKRVVGAGGEIIGNARVVMDELEPNAGLTAVTVHGSEDEDGTASEWLARARIVCANPPAGIELVTAAGEADSDPASVTATCPSGKNLLGTGAEIDGGGGQVVLDDVRPNAALTSATVTGLEDETGTTAQWFLRAHAICASP
jgi:hypothetical protein